MPEKRHSKAIPHAVDRQLHMVNTCGGKNISKIEVNGKCKLNIFDLDIDKLNIIVNDDSSLDKIGRAHV